MSKRFCVTIRRDAWVNYTCEIEAETAEAATAAALEAWATPRTSVKFEEDGLSEFVEVSADPADTVEIPQ